MSESPRTVESVKKPERRPCPNCGLRYCEDKRLCDMDLRREAADW